TFPASGPPGPGSSCAASARSRGLRLPTPSKSRAPWGPPRPERFGPTWTRREPGPHEGGLRDRGGHPKRGSPGGPGRALARQGERLVAILEARRDGRVQPGARTGGRVPVFSGAVRHGRDPHPRGEARRGGPRSPGETGGRRSGARGYQGRPGVGARVEVGAEDPRHRDPVGRSRLARGRVRVRRRGSRGRGGLGASHPATPSRALPAFPGQDSRRALSGPVGSASPAHARFRGGIRDVRPDRRRRVGRGVHRRPIDGGGDRGEGARRRVCRAEAARRLDDPRARAPGRGGAGRREIGGRSRAQTPADRNQRGIAATASRSRAAARAGTSEGDTGDGSLSPDARTAANRAAFRLAGGSDHRLPGRAPRRRRSGVLLAGLLAVLFIAVAVTVVLRARGGGGGESAAPPALQPTAEEAPVFPPAETAVPLPARSRAVRTPFSAAPAGRTSPSFSPSAPTPTAAPLAAATTNPPVLVATRFAPTPTKTFTRSPTQTVRTGTPTPTPSR